MEEKMEKPKAKKGRPVLRDYKQLNRRSTNYFRTYFNIESIFQLLLVLHALQQRPIGLRRSNPYVPENRSTARNSSIPQV